MKISNTFAVALVAALISSIASAKKHPGKDMGKLTEALITVYLASDEALGDSEGSDSLAMAFLEDDITYSYNKVQEGSDLFGVRSHFIGKTEASEDPGGDVLFPELSKNLGGPGLGYYSGYNYYYSWNCRWCPDDDDVAETAGIFGSSQSVADWEKAFCAQVTGSGLFAGVKGCRILTTDSMETTTAAQVGLELEDESSPSADDKYGRKKHPGKDMGKLTEATVTVFLASDEALEGSKSPDSLALAFLEDDLVYSFNKVQEGEDLHGVSSHFIGEAPAGAGDDLLFPELSKSLRGSGLGYYYGWQYYYSWNCRWCPDDDDVAETAGILGNSKSVEDWEKEFCAQVTGSGLFPGVKGCRILTETAETAQAQEAQAA